MTISALWPLCLLPFMVVIIIFYLLKQPAKEKLLSSLSYWQSIYKQQYSEKPFEKLRQDLLMYLQLLTVLLLIFSLCAPILHSAKKKEQIMLVLDTSASMQTLYSVSGTTRLEQAKKEAKKLMEASKTPLEVTIISCSNQAQVLLNSSTDYKKIISVLDNIEQQDCEGNLNYAVSLCESIYSQWDHGNCIFFTDSSLHTNSLPSQIYDLSTNTAAPKEPLLNSNLFISYVTATINDNNQDITIHAQVGNYGSEIYNSDVNFYINNTLVDVQSYHNTTLTNGSTITIRSKNIPFPKDLSYPFTIKAELQESDALNADNTAYNIVKDTKESSNPFRILLITKQNRFLEKALSAFQAFSNTEIYKINSMEDYDPKGTYDLSIFDGIFPEKLPKTGSVFLLPDSDHIKSSGKTFQELLPEFTYHGVVKNQYLNLLNSTASIDLEEASFPAAKALSFTAPAGAETIFSLDDGSTCSYMERRSSRFLIVFGFDLHDSNLPLQTDFPILMYNLLHECRNNRFFFFYDDTNVTAGYPVTFYPLDAKKKISIRNENGKEIKSLTPSSSLVATTVLEKCGIYDFYTKSKDYHAYLFVTFPYYNESDILAVPEFTSNPDTEKASVAKIGASLGIPIQKLLIFLSLLFLIAEFIVWIRRQWNRSHRPFFLALRACLVLLLCLSMLDIRVTLGKSTETTLFLVDVSDSMKRDYNSIETLLEQAARDLPSGSKAGIITFGADTRVEQFISRDLHFNGLETMPSTTATNLENALRTAAYMFSNESSKRIVLLTDGQENTGTVKNIASTLKDSGIFLKVLKFPKDTKEVLVSNINIPKKLSVGEKFQIEATIVSNVDTNALLSLYSGDTLKGTREVSLSSGINRFLFQDTLTKDGINSYRVLIEAEQDTETLNNEYVTFTQASKKTKLLLIEGREGEAAEFEKILKAGDFSYRKILPGSAPQKLLSLKKYAVVILENVHADDLPEKFRKLLQSYVTEGGGLIAIGGNNSFALGNYQNSSLDQILPVKSILPATKEVPESVIALVIDHSGSMGENEDNNITRLELAKEAAVSALSSLRETDSIGILAFDDSYDWVVPLTTISDSKEDIPYAIGGIESGGGTSIYPAIAEAVKQLSNCKEDKQKHIILLTDGEDSFKDYSDLYKTMEKETITLSTVAVSNGADTKLLESMAKAGNGRYYYADTSTNIPRIFAQEVFLSSDAYLVNKKLKPFPSFVLSSMHSPNDPLWYRQLAGVFTKFLYGYVRTAVNTDSTVLIQSDSKNSKDPILAVKKLGLGTTAAFTSDVTNEWTKAYAGLDNYAQFWKNLIDSCILKLDDSFSDEALSVTAENNIAHIIYSSSAYVTYERLYERNTIAICTDENGESVEVPLSPSKDPQTPYIYEADIPLEHNGIYSVVIKDDGSYITSSVQVKDEEVTNTQPFSATASCIFSCTYSMEYQLYDDDSTIDDFISLTNAELISGANDFYTGKLEHNAASHTLTPLLLLLVLFLFIIDIAARRFGLPSFLTTGRAGRLKKEWRKNKTPLNETPLNETAEKASLNKTVKQKERTETKRRFSNRQIKKKDTPELLDTSILLPSRNAKKKN